MKTRIEYVERLTGKLTGHKGVVFEDSPDTVHLIGLENYAMDMVDGMLYAPFMRSSDEYKTLNQPKPDINVGDKLKHIETGEIVTVKQVTLGKMQPDHWFIISDDTNLRVHVDLFEKVEVSNA